MAVLKDYHGFGSTHWETGSLSHALAYQGVTLPHSGAPISEAMLLGISGGITVGYFSFAYEGYDPHVALLTRNTFDPFQRMCERLGIVQDVRQTASAAKAAAQLHEALESGHPAIVFADAYSLPYNYLPMADDMWVIMPVLAVGADGVRVVLDDRARVPLEVDAATFAQARGRTKANRYRLLTVDLPSTGRLPRAVEKGLHDCIRLFTEAPPKGAKHNFGFAALDHWADLLVKDKPKASWANTFAPGSALASGLATAFSGIEIFGTGGQASRPLYADFLGDAAVLLNKSGLKQAGELFRRSGEQWAALGVALLPDEVEPLRETRDLLLRRQTLFREQGMAALDEMRAITARLDALHAAMAVDFPLGEGEVRALRERIRAQVLRVKDAERAAVEALEAGLSG